jgi:hypothetical protein
MGLAMRQRLRSASVPAWLFCGAARSSAADGAMSAMPAMPERPERPERPAWRGAARGLRASRARPRDGRPRGCGVLASEAARGLQHQHHELVAAGGELRDDAVKGTRGERLHARRAALRTPAPLSSSTRASIAEVEQDLISYYVLKLVGKVRDATACRRSGRSAAPRKQGHCRAGPQQDGCGESDPQQYRQVACLVATRV